MSEKSIRGAYGQAVSSDTYSRTPPGMFGRYDNVYRIWEDPFFRLSLERFLHAMGDEFVSKPLSIVDLGCGAGKGLELLSDLKPGRNHLYWTGGKPLVIKSYQGLDLSVDMIEKAKIDFSSNPLAKFDTADLIRGLDGHTGPYDIYFSSYGTLSHLDDESLENLFHAILEDMDSRAIFVMDMLGRFSLEWPSYWDAAVSGMQSYSMSHVMPETLRKSGQVPSFPMRFWGGNELSGFIETIAASSGIRIVSRLVQDRSIFCGRHLDTSEYGSAIGPLRKRINALHESYITQDLNDLVVHPMVEERYPEQSMFLNDLASVWNSILVHATETVREAGFEMPGPSISVDNLEGRMEFARAMQTVNKAVELAQVTDNADPVSNIIQPIIGIALRNLEWGMQKGLGTGHGLIAFFELQKS